MGPGSWVALSTLLIVGAVGIDPAGAQTPANIPEGAQTPAKVPQEAVEAAARDLKAAGDEQALVRTRLETAALVRQTEQVRKDTIALRADNDRRSTQAVRPVDWVADLDRAAGLAIPARVSALDLSSRFGVVCTRAPSGNDNDYSRWFTVPKDGARPLDTRPIREFAACYRRRAGQIQLGSDIAGWTTGVALVGLLVAGNTMAPKKTTVMWTSGAVVPMILNDLRGSGYRSQLYSAGADALDQVAFRYDVLAFRLQHAELHFETLTGNGDAIDKTCADLAESLRSAKTLPDTARRTVVLEGVQALSARCDAAAKTHSRLKLILSDAVAARSALQLYAADDALRVAARMDLLQRALRASPFEVFRSIAKLPFATVEALLSGEGLHPRSDPRSDLEYLVGGRRLSFATPALPDELDPAVALSQAFEQALKEYVAEAPKGAGKKRQSEAEKAAEARRVLAETIQAVSSDARRTLRRAIPPLNEARLNTAAVLHWDQEAIPSLDPRRIDKRVLSLSSAIIASEAAGEADSKPSETK